MKQQQETIEQKVGRAVLQQAQTINIGSRTYKVSPPSTATLILVSEEISKLPAIKLDTAQVVEESLHIAKECEPIGAIIATMIMGARRHSTMPLANWMYQRRRRRLAHELLTELTPSELHGFMASLLTNLQLGDFFAITTFLTELNLISPTKVVNQKSKTTASGQSLQA